MRALGRFLFGIVLGIVALTMIGLDVHVAFRRTEFAHTANFVIALVPLFGSWWCLMPLTAAGFMDRLTRFAQIVWRTPRKTGEQKADTPKKEEES